MKKRMFLAGLFLAAAPGCSTSDGSSVANATTATANADDKVTVVKCLGIALKGHNDCGSTDGRHDCSGKADKNLDPTEWVYVPEGPLCEKWGGTKMMKDGEVVKKQKNRGDFIDS